MALAGNMKLKNFLALVALAAAAGSVGLYFACSGKKQDKEDAAHLAQVRPKEPVALPVDAAAAPPVDAAAAPAEVGDLPVRPYDPVVLAWQGRTVKGGKQKDVAHGQPYKIDVYQDGGKSSVNRVKVDANRNNKWDDKFTFEPGKITLEHAPADDEKYTEVYHWSGTRWVKGKP